MQREHGSYGMSLFGQDLLCQLTNYHLMSFYYISADSVAADAKFYTLSGYDVRILFARGGWFFFWKTSPLFCSGYVNQSRS